MPRQLEPLAVSLRNSLDIAEGCGIAYKMVPNEPENWHLWDISWVHWLKTAPGSLLLRLPWHEIDRVPSKPTRENKEEINAPRSSGTAQVASGSSCSFTSIWLLAAALRKLLAFELWRQ
jgi:hypothetical protein